MSDAADPWADLVAQKRGFWRAVRWGPAVMVVAVLASRWPLGAGALVMGWVLWVVVSAARVEGLACPRCRQELFRDGMWHNQFSSHCLHCGQSIGAPVKSLFPSAGAPAMSTE